MTAVIEDGPYASIGTLISQTQPLDPLLCFDRARLARRVSSFLEHFPGQVLWALKSNPFPAVVSGIREAGITSFDVASRREIELVQSLAPGAELQFNHPIKLAPDIDYAYGAGCRVFAVDDPSEITKIARVLVACGANLGNVTILTRFRMSNPPADAVYDFGSKFGALKEKAAQLLLQSRRAGFRVGLCFHPGSQTRHPEIYTRMMLHAREIVELAFSSDERHLACLNVGGGFPCQYPGEREPPLDDYFRAIRLGSLAHDCPLSCEPGRAIVADSMSLLARVSLNRNDGRLHINDGFYGSFMELPFVDFTPPVRVYRANGMRVICDPSEEAEFTVFGPTCDSIDKLPRPIALPKSVEQGDYIEFGLMGAYTNASSTAFNGMNSARLVTIESIEDWFCRDFGDNSSAFEFQCIEQIS